MALRPQLRNIFIIFAISPLSNGSAQRVCGTRSVSQIRWSTLLAGVLHYFSIGGPKSRDQALLEFCGILVEKRAPIAYVKFK